MTGIIYIKLGGVVVRLTMRAGVCIATDHPDHDDKVGLTFERLDIPGLAAAERERDAAEPSRP